MLSKGLSQPSLTVVRKVMHAGHTFGSFADELLESAVSSSIGASRICIVFDVYREHSIKNAERGHRETGKPQFRRIIGNQTIKQYAAFLSTSNNKLELIRFLVSRWKTNCSYIGNTEINVTFDESCIQLGNGNNTNVEELSCNHEEADTRLLFHAKKISESFRRIIIYTPGRCLFDCTWCFKPNQWKPFHQNRNTEQSPYNMFIQSQGGLADQIWPTRYGFGI